MKSEATHDQFLQYLKQSTRGVHSVAQWFVDRGFAVRMPAATAAKRHTDWKEHADGGDLFIEMRIEVKQLSVKFTCANDWPFKGKFIVCARHAWDRAQPKPRAYYILSACGEYVAVVNGKTCKQWYVEKRKDSRFENYEQEFYLCPMDCVQFMRM